MNINILRSFLIIVKPSTNLFLYKCKQIFILVGINNLTQFRNDSYLLYLLAGWKLSGKRMANYVSSPCLLF